MAVAHETLVYTVHLFGRDSAVAADALKQIEKGQMALGKVAALCRPVAHLSIEIETVAAAVGR